MAEATRVVSLILTTDRQGLGTLIDDPVRGIYQLWTLDGYLVAEYDPHTKKGVVTDKIATIPKERT